MWNISADPSSIINITLPVNVTQLCAVNNWTDVCGLSDSNVCGEFLATEFYWAHVCIAVLAFYCACMTVVLYCVVADAGGLQSWLALICNCYRMEYMVRDGVDCILVYKRQTLLTSTLRSMWPDNMRRMARIDTEEFIRDTYNLEILGLHTTHAFDTGHLRLHRRVPDDGLVLLGPQVFQWPAIARTEIPDAQVQPPDPVVDNVDDGTRNA